MIHDDASAWAGPVPDFTVNSPPQANEQNNIKSAHCLHVQSGRACWSLSMSLQTLSLHVLLLLQSSDESAACDLQVSSHRDAL